ncbi:hypothetical protein GYN67_09045 [Lactococcus piscium]|uniref:hypothetical protein n=1 Tax=Pseudolactococcus carnosus TaxID=2749961 RepID=UPI001FBAF532|nr:hypothetical protein [Lactococcus carnosus]MCJ1996835.1 hypothetical protein [Lactococcus carnosus]
MIKSFLSKLSQYDFRKKTHHHLQPSKESHQSIYLKIKVILLLTLPAVLSLLIWLFLKKGVIIKTYTILKPYNHTGLLLFSVILLALFIAYLIGLWLFSMYSPISVYRDRKLFLKALSQISILNYKADNQYITLALEFWYDNATLFIKILSGGQITEERSVKLPILLQDYLISKSRFLGKKEIYQNMSDPQFVTGSVLISFTPPLIRKEVTGNYYEV